MQILHHLDFLLQISNKDKMNFITFKIVIKFPQNSELLTLLQMPHICSWDIAQEKWLHLVGEIEKETEKMG